MWYRNEQTHSNMYAERKANAVKQKQKVSAFFNAKPKQGLCLHDLRKTTCRLILVCSPHHFYLLLQWNLQSPRSPSPTLSCSNPGKFLPLEKVLFVFIFKKNGEVSSSSPRNMKERKPGCRGKPYNTTNYEYCCNYLLHLKLRNWILCSWLSFYLEELWHFLIHF